MFRPHRDDLIAAQEKERLAWNATITILCDQIEFLRFQLLKAPHQSPGLQQVYSNFAEDEDEEKRRKMYLSEEEEDMLALRLNDHLDTDDMERLASQFDLPHLEVSE